MRAGSRFLPRRDRFSGNSQYTRQSTVLPARLADLGTHLDLLEDAGYLTFTESGPLHVETPAGGILYFLVAQVFKWTSNGNQIALLIASFC
jgi:hypothetical protein